MKKLIFLTAIIGMIFFSGCKGEGSRGIDCWFTSPESGQTFNVDEDILVDIYLNPHENHIDSVQLCVDDVAIETRTEPPYNNFLIKGGTLSIGEHELFFYAYQETGHSGTGIPIFIVAGENAESKDFETFEDGNGELPQGWQAEGWYIEPIDYDDNYSLASKTPEAWMSTTKTATENITAFEFYNIISRNVAGDNLRHVISCRTAAGNNLHHVICCRSATGNELHECESSLQLAGDDPT